ncbi:MAG: TonB-dependent receptor [Lacibacter sp.]
MKNYFFLLLLLMCSTSLFAQTRQVKGKVTDETGTPLPSVTVLLSGSKKGVQTDVNGSFKIDAPGAGTVTLVFSYTGYKSITVKADGNSELDVKLEKDVAVLEDVVVIGYQTIKRKNLLASVSSVGAKELKDIPIYSAEEMLNGRLAGVTATTAEGSPDADIRIRIRGGMSITNDNSPLYIVDGVQVERALSVIAPQDIQSIDVLKDAAATAIYGARGANGVIVITTKTGKPGKAKVTFNSFVGVKYLPKKLGVLSVYDFVIYQSERSRGSSTDSLSFLKNFGTTWDTLSNYKNVSPIDWQDEIFGNTGITTTQNIGVSGGTKKITYNFGYTLNKDKAIVINSNYTRHLFNFKSDYNVTRNLKTGVTLRYTNQNVVGAGVSDAKGSSYNRLRNAVKYKPYLSANQDIEEADPLADPNVGNGLNLVNPIGLANAEYRKKTTNSLNFTAYVSYKITKNLTFRSTFGYDRTSLVDRQFSDSITPLSIIQGAAKPVVGLDTSNRQTITNSNVLTYSVADFKNKHDFDFLIGEETYDLNTQNYSRLYRNFQTFTNKNVAIVGADYLGIPFAGYPKATKTKYTSLSFFGRVNYSYMDKYLFSFNVRADGSSKFAPGKQWGYFPSGSVAWRIKKEKFLENVDFINDLKIRGGFGLVGNNRIGDYLYITTFQNDGNLFYGINNNPVLAYYSASLANPNLKWESTVNKNIGLDFTFIKNRFDFSVDLYENQSKDLLLDVLIATTFGYRSQYQNIGKTSNRGIELQLNAVIARKTNGFNWSANFNIAFNENKVVELGKGQDFFYPGASWGVSGQPTDYIEKIGSPVGSFWGLVADGFYKVSDFDYNTSTGVYTLKTGVVNNSGIIGVVQPGSMKFKDVSGPNGVPDGVIDVNYDRKIIGNPTPKFTGGLNQMFTYKNWDASVFVNFSYGNDIYNANKIEFTNGYTNNSNMIDIMQDRWKVVTATGATAQWVNGTTVYGIAPDALTALNANAKIWQPLKGSGAFYPSSWAIEDGSFLRINNITIGYSLPAKAISRLRMSKLRFYVTGNNLAVFTNYSGFDPEVSVRSSPLTPGLDFLPILKAAVLYLV